jgi:hypothetical protein
METKHVSAIDAMKKNNVERHLTVLKDLNFDCLLPKLENIESDLITFDEPASVENLRCTVKTLMEIVAKTNFSPEQYPFTPSQALLNYFPEIKPLGFDTANGWPSADGIGILVGLKVDPSNLTEPIIWPFAFLKMQQLETTEDENLLHELAVGMVLNQMRNYLPCFMYVYGGFYCEYPDETDIETDRRIAIPGSFCKSDNIHEMNTCLLSECINSPAGMSNLSDFLKNNTVDARDKVKTLLLLFFSLAEANRRYKFVHGDLHGQNILIRELQRPTDPMFRKDFIFDYVDYESGAVEQIKIPSVHYIPVVIDFGRSSIKYKQYLLTPFVFDEKSKKDIFCRTIPRPSSLSGDLYYNYEIQREHCSPENAIYNGENLPGYDIIRIYKYLEADGALTRDNFGKNDEYWDIFNPHPGATFYSCFYGGAYDVLPSGFLSGKKDNLNKFKNQRLNLTLDKTNHPACHGSFLTTLIRFSLTGGLGSDWQNNILASP